MEKEGFRGKRKRWVRVPNEEDIYLNLICQKCGREIKDKLSCLTQDHGIKVYCKTCGKKEIASNPDFIELNPNKISTKFVQNMLNGDKKKTIFVHGNDLYIDFVILIRNYRDKIEFCNI